MSDKPILEQIEMDDDGNITLTMDAFQKIMESVREEAIRGERERISNKVNNWMCDQMDDPWSNGMNVELTNGYVRACKDLLASLQTKEGEEK